MKRFFFLMALCMLSSFVRAEEDVQAFIAEARQHENEQIRDNMPYAIEAKKREIEIVAPYKDQAKLASLDAQSLISHNQNPLFLNEGAQQQTARKNGATAIIFVSFSMPDGSIVSYLRDAKKIQASVVIRGLVNNSFKETFLKMATLVKEAGGGGVELNPPLFKKFAITAVPAVVVIPNSQLLMESIPVFTQNDFDVVYGDIPVFDAIKAIRDHGSVSKEKANELLSDMKDSLHA